MSLLPGMDCDSGTARWGWETRVKGGVAEVVKDRVIVGADVTGLQGSRTTLRPSPSCSAASSKAFQQSCSQYILESTSLLPSATPKPSVRL